MPRGSGAIVVHRALEQALPGYRVLDYNPWWTLFPPALSAFARGSADLFHTAPDYAVFSTPRRVPRVITFHNYVLDPFMRAYSTPLQWLHYRTDLRLFTKLALHRAHAVTAVSQFVADLIANDLGYEGAVRVIPNGIDTEKFVPRRSRAERPTIRVLFSGNLSRRKGAHLLPEIAQRLPAGVEVWCATGLRGGMRAFTRDNLKLLGRVPPDAMPILYQEVDLLLLPTAREGLSLAVAEAMASGLPIVASNVSTLPEMVHDGLGGFLCALDDPGAFADAIGRLAADSELRRAMGEYNRTRAEREYTLAGMVRAYRDLFESVLDDRTLAD